MAKRRTRSSKHNKNSIRVNRRIRNSRRVDIYNANRRLPLYRVTPSKTINLTEIEDLRTFNPTGNLVGYSGTVVKDNPSTKIRQTKAPLRFRNPERVLVCVRRSIRKEVLFAKSKAGRTGQKRPKFNRTSTISCRR